METIEQMDLASVIALFEQSSLNELELSCSRFTIKLKRASNGEAVCAAPLEQKKNIPTKEKQPEVKQEELITITSPIVGTFYLTPAPDAPPYVREGDIVAPGDVLCTIEAMKLMNQMPAEFPCEIISVLAQPESMVEFGQPLFSVRKR
ncbi:biotin/lipoyl-containing protein [uncultured Sphaerochaeta sp.]|uniref:acetyl-CoA carboxylase biotin carboxyl carrier protein n=1 Tax=uncultured Sphaerochaeta sp. TaxID=886478 RepID=UPI002A0A28EC|nr:biotin/lipoyl-containing protein [uncultured Sphaerochaeta sp.]